MLQHLDRLVTKRRKPRWGLAAIFLLTAAVLVGIGVANYRPEPQTVDAVQVETVLGELERPWSLAFLPDGRMLITERPGRLLLIDLEQRRRHTVEGLPNIEPHGQGGLLDVALHPRFADNGWIYLSYAGKGPGGYATEVARARLDGRHLRDWQVLITATPHTDSTRHFGSRLAFDPDGYLFITTGDRGARDRAQDLGDLAGSVLRLHDDGSVPEDNPFVGREDARPEIYSYGHRNPQGLAIHPDTGEPWVQEHGPRGGDEINRILPGRNYGWPVITYGKEYYGPGIGDTRQEGMEQPVYHWTPSIAPSGMVFYSGDRFPNWRGDLLNGALKLQHLNRLVMERGEVQDEIRLLESLHHRIRDVRQGPDGYVYLLVDGDRAPLLRLKPQP